MTRLTPATWLSHEELERQRRQRAIHRLQGQLLQRRRWWKNGVPSTDQRFREPLQ